MNEICAANWATNERESERAREQRICITGNGNISQLLRMGVWGVAVNAFTRAPRATTTMKYHPRLSGGQLKAMLCGAPKGRAFTLHNKPDYGLVSSRRQAVSWQMAWKIFLADFMSVSPLARAAARFGRKQIKHKIWLQSEEVPAYRMQLYH